MAPTTRLDQQRRELLPILVDTFVELGYRRATTAELARRCEVRENILYRHWRDKSAMFVAALDHVHELTISTWQRLLDSGSNGEAAAGQLLDYEARHLGEFGNYRIIFSALGDLDTPEIKQALRRMYRGFHRLIRKTLLDARRGRDRDPGVDQGAWAVIGIGTIATILGELGLLSATARGELIRSAGNTLIKGNPSN